ncbi:isochorismatase hydrolase : Isochorismatase hydrolase OS=Solibacter usitatus (strain Ellin6076) GN=Acid_1892 PE=4 SV=1: Isochorismatase [Gemmata massiliana]|uniref:Isochorismatase-like domain-containing protein n=1 Tax=Gemmata massiliana TaxID=1210884 RepID=A0A6P2DJX0_9BACT|nr:cysteine hydrolase family protein [Gemmata massiliana]VTS02574.1 isochorismatase hydrolase : Isochorismatase hydrolase OS=Solibacter usitatus (strain Ellin6076) GN=Acid_1892 PE=4 SV=1: Isochorismatase [Gemmata massiliana]
MLRALAPLTLATLFSTIVAVPGSAAAPEKLKLTARKVTEVEETVTVTDPATNVTKTVSAKRGVPTNVTIEVDPTKTAIVVCDMWDDHWCQSASKRCAELAKQAEPVLKACRDRGMTIIHCPSDTIPFYKDHPARKRVADVKKVEPPKSKDLPNPPLPVDDTDGGCDDEKPAKQFKAWTRQNATITIDEKKDYITDNGTEVYSIMKEKGIDTLFVMGVHTNMCVLNRTFAIKQMVKWNVRTFLVRDLTDAMYNPKMKPFVAHDKGTQLIIEHIEKHWCPTIESKSILATK